MRLANYLSALKQAGVDIVFEEGVPGSFAAPAASLYIDVTNKSMYVNAGSEASPSWTKFSALDSTIGTSEIEDGAITNDKVNATAGIVVTKLEGLADGEFLIGVDGSPANNAKVTMSGDGTLSQAGAFAVTNVSDAVYQRSATVVTATTDGLTTGIIPDGTAVVAVSSDDANKIITTPDIATTARFAVVTGGTGCEVRTPSGSNVQINTVDCDGSNELALVSGSLYVFTKLDTSNWIAIGYTSAGAAIATLVPDAA